MPMLIILKGKDLSGIFNVTHLIDQFFHYTITYTLTLERSLTLIPYQVRIK